MGNMAAHEGNEGCFKIHRNANKFELKYSKDKRLTILVRSEEYSLLSDVRDLLYTYFGDARSLYNSNKYEIKKVAERLLSKVTKGELERIMDERVSFHEEDDKYDVQQKKDVPIESKIVIKKGKRSDPVPGDFIIINLEGKERELGIVCRGEHGLNFVFLKTGIVIPLEKALSEEWKFAEVIVEAV